jgi:Protein of unknown function (DUF3800)
LTNYAAYFDDSGHPDDKPYVVVAGFISTEAQWLLFEREWREHLKPFKINIFHMADFEASNKWPRKQKDNLLHKLVVTIRTRTRLQIQAIVPMPIYREINNKYAFEEAFGAPYALAGRTVAKSINEWKQKHMKADDNICVFFEDGTKHKGDFMDSMARDGLPCPAFLKKSDAVPLQAADLAAWEGFRAIRTETARAGFKYLIDKHPLSDGIFTLEGLEEMCLTVSPHVPLRANITPSTEISYESNPKKLRRRTIK